MEIKNIWLVNKYAMPPQYESRLRTIKFAHYLGQMGYKVTIFGCSIMHNMDIDLINDNSLFIEHYYNDLHFVHIRGLHYGKAANVKRLLSEVRFHYSFVKVAKRFEKPDIIVATTNAIISNPILKYAHKNGIKYITESLDVWPDDFVSFGLVSAKNPLMKYLFWRAKKTYAESDANVFSWIGCFRYFEQKGWDKGHDGPIDLRRVYYVNNGVDLDDFNRWKQEYKLDDTDLLSDKKRIIYLGSIRLLNNVLRLVKAAAILKSRTDVEFLIYGDGDDRESLIAYCKEHELNNVKFKAKWTNPKYVPYILSRSYLNVMNYISSDFGKNGISSSKMFQYMASGRPIVCNIDSYRCPIKAANIGIAHEMRDENDYAKAIETLLNLSVEEYEAMCKRAVEAAKEYDYKYLAKQMAKIIESL